ncbi:TetR/AcrR family transcriptional regulator [Blastococcus sp. CT_GayMR19]|uniref:TetR/AcrR family transcriptional regulator n=1 Tax=Blastococcus sp. CT_GayMR19 TaxID=2559608 RepID=UPI001431E841|nr:TetR/AcrR family transcriptional regulator [Blastococcus sp. CT_GayMR19]
MGDLKDRRARKKAQTREQIQRVAQRMFAERGFETVTIADIAGAADVAVQTVFNHFATKEELFFADRAEWVDGAAAAVRSRPRDVEPLTALREHFLGTVRLYLRALTEPHMQAMVATLDASPALSAYERELHHEAVRRLTAALIEACPEGNSAVTGAPPSVTLRTSAWLTASLWCAAVRALLIEQRAELTDAVGAVEAAVAVERLAEHVLGQLAENPTLLQCCPAVAPQTAEITGWPAAARRAV